MYYNRSYNGQELNPYNIRSWVQVLPYHDTDYMVLYIHIECRTASKIWWILFIWTLLSCWSKSILASVRTGFPPRRAILERSRTLSFWFWPDMPTPFETNCRWSWWSRKRRQEIDVPLGHKCPNRPIERIWFSWCCHRVWSRGLFIVSAMLTKLVVEEGEFGDISGSR